MFQLMNTNMQIIAVTVSLALRDAKVRCKPWKGNDLPLEMSAYAMFHSPSWNKADASVSTDI